MRRLGFLPLALAAVVAIGCDNNRRDNTSATPADPAAVGTAGEADRNKPGMGDNDFVNDAAIAGMAEVELGRMASEKGASPDVKKFGKMMVDDHTAAGDRLKAIATQYKVEWPTGLDDQHRDLRDKLAKLSGSEFDREYMSAMVDGHEGVAGKLESRIDKETLSKEDMARICAPVTKRPSLAPYNGFGKRTPSDQPPVLTPAEQRAVQNGGPINGHPAPVGDVGAPAPR